MAIQRTKHEILVGLSISLTGRFSRQGQQAFEGIRLWQSYNKATGGISQVRLLYYDDESRAIRAKENTLRLLRGDRVDILFGPYSSGLTLAVAPIAEEHKKVLWNHGGSSDEIFNRGYCYVVSTASPASDYLCGLPEWLKKQYSWLRRICILYSTSGTFGYQVARGVIEGARPLGIHSLEVLPMDFPVPQASEALVLTGAFEDEVRIIKARDWPDTLKVIAAVAAGAQAFYEEVGERAEGVIGPSQWESAARFKEIQGPDSNWFAKNFRKQFGRLPEYTAAGSFAMGLVVAECIGRAGSLEDDRLREVATQLDFSTFYGRFRIDPRTGCQIGHRILLTQWQQGRKVVL